MTVEEACRTLIPGYDPWRDADGWEFDSARAEAAVGFFRDMLTFPDGEHSGEPFELQPWQQAIVGNIYGWEDSAGHRRYREAFIYLPRKNGKTAMSAGLLLLEMFMRPTPGGQYFSAASTREQAALIFKDACRMVKANDEMSELTRIVPSSKVIERIDEMGGFYRSTSSDAGAQHGTRPCFAIVDELHAHRNANLVEALTTGTAVKGLQPLIVYITTADYIRESVCNVKWKYACQVRDGGAKDAGFMPVIYEAPRESDWTDPETWKAANPNYGISVDEDYLARECEKAKVNPTDEIAFKRLHLCMQTAHANRLIPMQLWDGCYDKYNPDDMLGQPCFGGLDVATEKDFAAFVLYFPESHRVLPWFWLPFDNAAVRQSQDGVPYQTWVDQNLITTTDGNFISHRSIGDTIESLAALYDIRTIAFDRAQAAGLYERLSDFGLTMLKHSQQVYAMASPTKRLQALVGNGTLKQNAHPVLNWNVQNAVGVTDAFLRTRPDREKSLEKIDGIVALIMAIGASDVAVDTPFEFEVL
jgi:phage terminase large subunit-like protein